MATYYRWRKSTVIYQENTGSVRSPYEFYGATGVYEFGRSPQMNQSTGYFTGGTREGGVSEGSFLTIGNLYYYGFSNPATSVFKVSGGGSVYGKNNNGDGNLQFSGTGTRKYSSSEPGTFQEYVYSTDSSGYPNASVTGGYYYDQRTKVTSPTNPSQISYSSTISTLSTTISWQPATSNTSYPVSRYELSYSTNGGSSWQVAGTTEETSYQFGITPGITQIQFRVRAMDTNSQYSDYVTGSNSTVQYMPANPPVLVLPDNAKLGDTITISWNSVADATNYILQRKVDGGDWTQIYSGANLSTTNLVDNLGISYRIAFNVGSNFTSEWSQEYRLNTYEKLIEMTYLGDDGQYMPLYPRTVSSAVVNASDLINTVSLSGTYQGTGIESNTVLLNTKEGIYPKIAFVSNTEGEVEIVNNFDDNGNLIVDNNNNIAGEEYSYVVIGKKED